MDALDDPDGDPHSLQASLRETLALSTKMSGGGGGGGDSGRLTATAASRASMSLQSSPPPRRQFAATVDALKLREAKLNKAEDTAQKFLEVCLNSCLMRFILVDAGIGWVSSHCQEVNRSESRKHQALGWKCVMFRTAKMTGGYLWALE